MRSTHAVHVFAVAVLLGVYTSGCATTASCRPGEPTTVCCIKKHPLSPQESCAASAAEILETLMAMEAAFQATRHDEDEEEEDDFANNAELPEWKQECIRGYVQCRRQGWAGNCYECLRLCEGQRKWPKGCPPLD